MTNSTNSNLFIESAPPQMLWRVSRGNAFLRQDEIEELFEDRLLGEAAESKSAFLVFFQARIQ
jgi:hypothetical protein